MKKIEVQSNQQTFGTTLASFCSFTANPYLLYLVQSKILQTAVSHQKERPFCRKGGVIISLKKIRRILQNERAEANYLSTMVFIFIAVLLLVNDRGDMSIYTCFLVMGVVILVSFLLLYASVKITCINIRNGAKMELNNLSASIYADTYRSQRETNFSEYLNTLYSSSDYTAMLEETVTDGLANKLPLSTDDYQVRNISLSFHVAGDRVEYVISCDAEFYISMFGRQYPAITRHIELTGFHNTKF